MSSSKATTPTPSVRGMKTVGEHPSMDMLRSATRGFDLMFENDITGAVAHFNSKDDPFHYLGAGTIAFLEAALGMETNQMAEASRCLALSETTTRKQMKAPKEKFPHSRFPAGLELEIINADAVVFLGLTHALSESYMGYLQCMYSLNSAHSKFTKLYKTVFPAGIDEALVSAAEAAATPASFSNTGPTLSTLSVATSPASPTSPAPAAAGSATLQVPGLSHRTSSSSLASTSSIGSGAVTPDAMSQSQTTPAPATKGFFSRWLGSSPAAASSEPTLALHAKGHGVHAGRAQEYVDGPVEDLIIAGTAFGYGLFNLVFSLLPKQVQRLVGFLGFQHDRGLALKALRLASAKGDIHGVFSGLVLMTYYGVVLLLSGWQADEQGRLDLYERIITRVESRYPHGALWILNRAKILRMEGEADRAIDVLERGLNPETPHSFQQADMMLLFELAWIYLGQRRYQESADAFLRITKVNEWSHATYYFLSAGCYFSMSRAEGISAEQREAHLDKCQELMDQIMELIDNQKKVGGKDLPTEVFIRKKLNFYREKQIRRGGDPARYAESMRVSCAEELAIFWNTHMRVSAEICRAHIADVMDLTPALTIKSRTMDSLREANALANGVSALDLEGSSSSSSASASRPSTSTVTTTTSSPAASPVDLDTPDEVALRALLLGICHRTVEEFGPAKAFLEEAHALQGKIKVNTWIGGVGMFELAVLVLREVDWKIKNNAGGGGDATAGSWKSEWEQAMVEAERYLDVASALSPSSIDLSSRLESRISMVRDEIDLKKASFAGQ